MSICHYAMRILCMIWKTADPQTTKMKRPNNQGPTAYFSSAGFSDFGTLPLVVIFLLCFSLANLILCLAAISVRMRLPTFKNLYNFLTHVSQFVGVTTITVHQLGLTTLSDCYIKCTVNCKEKRKNQETSRDIETKGEMTDYFVFLCFELVTM